MLSSQHRGELLATRTLPLGAECFQDVLPMIARSREMAFIWIESGGAMGKRLSQGMRQRDRHEAISCSVPQEDLLAGNLLYLETPGPDKQHRLIQVPSRSLASTLCKGLCKQSPGLSVLDHLSIRLPHKP